MGITLIKNKCSLLSCGKAYKLRKEHFNRALKLGARQFCSWECFSESRRKHIPKNIKISRKREYDIEYRAKNKTSLKFKRAEYFKKTYPLRQEHFRALRKKRMAAHIEYCRQPKYRAKKHIYDRERYAKDKFGEFWESHVLAMQIEEAVLKKISKYEIRLKNKTYNKAQRRARNGQVKRGYA